MRPGAPQSRRYVYTGPGEVSSLVTDPPGTPVTPCKIRSFTSIQMAHTHRHACVQAQTPRHLLVITHKSSWHCTANGLIGLEQWKQWNSRAADCTYWMDLNGTSHHGLAVHLEVRLRWCSSSKLLQSWHALIGYFARLSCIALGAALKEAQKHPDMLLPILHILVTQMICSCQGSPVIGMFSLPTAPCCCRVWCLWHCTLTRVEPGCSAATPIARQEFNGVQRCSPMLVSCLTSELSTTHNGHHRVQVLPASYVKFIESAGGEVVPLPQQIQFEDSTVSAKLEGPKFTKREREKESEREREINRV